MKPARTGKGTGRKGKGDYASYLQFMKTQLTELLTNYGPIGGIWLDGHWDQTADLKVPPTAARELTGGTMYCMANS